MKRKFIFYFVILLLIQLILSNSSGSQSEKLEAQAKCSSQKCSRHWIFAIDKSGSMQGLKWQSLTNSLKIIFPYLLSIGYQSISLIKFDGEAYATIEHLTSKEISFSVLGSPGGGTNFAYPLLKAIKIIEKWNDENTCYVMITDGQASLPMDQIKLFNTVRKGIEDKGKDFCSICYFITQSSVPPPLAYTDLCRHIDAKLQELVIQQLKSSLLRSITIHIEENVQKLQEDYYIWIFLFIILTFVIVFVYYCIVKPKNIHKWYVKNFKNAGYRVLQIPFEPLGTPYKKIYNRSKTATDGFSFIKQNYPEYDVVIMNIMNIIFVDLIHPDLTKQIYSYQKIMPFHKNKLQVNSLIRFGRGLAFSEEEMWKKKRKIITTIFNFDFLSRLAPKIAQICDQNLNQFENKYGVNGKQVQYNIFEATLNIATSVMFECFFGAQLSRDKIEGEKVNFYLIDLVDRVYLQTTDIFYLLFGVKFLNLGLRKGDKEVNRRLQVYNSWGKNVVSEKIKSIKEKVQKGEEFSESKDLLELLILNKLKKQKQGQQLVYDESQIVGQFTTFFIGGSDTTSYYLLMTLYLISLHPQVEKKVREQINEYMKEDDFSYENLKNFTYIDCVQKQVTRYYGPVNAIIFRDPRYDDFLNNVPIKKGTILNVQPLGLHYSQKYYQNPKEFIPQRWLNESDISQESVGGFGGGARACIGKHLARLETKIGVIKFLKRYSKIELPQKQLRMILHFIYGPEQTKVKMTKN